MGDLLNSFGSRCYDYFHTGLGNSVIGNCSNRHTVWKQFFVCFFFFWQTVCWEMFCQQMSFLGFLFRLFLLFWGVSEMWRGSDLYLTDRLQKKVSSVSEGWPLKRNTIKLYTVSQYHYINGLKYLWEKDQEWDFIQTFCYVYLLHPHPEQHFHQW